MSDRVDRQWMLGLFPDHFDPAAEATFEELAALTEQEASSTARETSDIQVSLLSCMVLQGLAERAVDYARHAAMSHAALAEAVEVIQYAITDDVTDLVRPSPNAKVAYQALVHLLPAPRVAALHQPQQTSFKRPLTALAPGLLLMASPQELEDVLRERQMDGHRVQKLQTDEAEILYAAVVFGMREEVGAITRCRRVPQLIMSALLQYVPRTLRRAPRHPKLVLDALATLRDQMPPLPSEPIHEDWVFQTLTALEAPEHVDYFIQCLRERRLGEGFWPHALSVHGRPDHATMAILIDLMNNQELRYLQSQPLYREFGPDIERRLRQKTLDALSDLSAVPDEHDALSL